VPSRYAREDVDHRDSLDGHERGVAPGHKLVRLEARVRELLLRVPAEEVGKLALLFPVRNSTGARQKKRLVHRSDAKQRSPKSIDDQVRAGGLRKCELEV
jgi:hypothetical protein